MKTTTKTKTPPVKFTDGEREMLHSAMWRLWQQIGGDAEQACEEAGVPLKNADAAEFVLDAQRLEEEAARVGDRKLEAALAKFRTLDWKKQVRFLLSRYTLA